MTEDSISVPSISRFRAAMILAILADAVQVIFLPLFVAGAESPADDILDCGIAVALFSMLGWHWEFLPSLLGKLVPGVDLVPFWTLAVANVYRKSKRIGATTEKAAPEVEQHEEPRG
jgi:hypothetical protein